jgi:hypothetical protein
MGVYTLRGNEARPRSIAIVSQTWNPQAAIPPDAHLITVLLHGFNVSTTDAEKGTGFFSTYFKRLYWTGHPVIGPLPNGDGSAYVIGIDWPGDESASLIGASTVVYFPEDEFHALESGVPLARFLAQLSSNHPSSQINLLAHSLGNMVVNSALTRPELPANTVNKYVMNDAAISADAFNTDYSGGTVHLGLQAVAVKEGFPNDSRWQTEWDLAGIALRNNWYTSLVDPSVQALNAARPRYCWRWRQVRTGSVPDGAPGVSEADPSSSIECDPNDPTKDAHRGPWLGFFNGNVSKTKVFNTFNSGDGVLSIVWVAKETIQTPNTAILGLQAESLLSGDIPFWATLRNTDLEENLVFGDQPANSSNIIRQWAELAHWFPSVSRATGQGTLPTIANIDFSSFAPDVSKQPKSILESHSYMTILPLNQVWCGFQKYRDIFKDDFNGSGTLCPAGK